MALPIMRAISSVGRASRLHREGRRFEPVIAHHFRRCRDRGTRSAPLAALLRNSAVDRGARFLAGPVVTALHPPDLLPRGIV